MVACIHSCGVEGVTGRIIQVEVDVSGGLPFYDTVGLPDKSVSESRERVRSAIRNMNIRLPAGRVIVNLAPADVKKVGTIYDLPIALGILAANGEIIDDRFSRSVFVGELALDGAIRPVNGVLAMASAAKENGFEWFFCPYGNRVEASYGDIKVVAVSSLAEAVDILMGRCPFQVEARPEWKPQSMASAVDFSQIKGQYLAKRAAEIAAGGGHNILFTGPPGGGKTMLAKAIPAILPKLTFEEAMELTRIYSIAGRLQEGIVTQRPFVAPHHGSSSAALVGGGPNAMLGEITLAHLGVLFLDEMPEFDRAVLEALRQPMEDGVINVSRVKAKTSYPARFMLVGAMNPCPCGNYGSKAKPCICGIGKVEKYRARLSGPLMDRIDLFVTMNEITYEDLHSKGSAEESSEEVRKRVDSCRKIQTERYEGTGIFCNAQMGQRELEKYCTLNGQAEELYKSQFIKRGFNGRANARTLKVARTIADLDGDESIQSLHIAEALQFRSLNY